MIEVNLFREFGTFREGNNNSPLENNNNPLLLLLSSEFGGELGEGFNLLPEGNIRGLDSNVAALVNALTGINLEINYIERESNHVKSTEFGRMEIEDLNE